MLKYRSPCKLGDFVYFFPMKIGLIGFGIWGQKIARDLIKLGAVLHVFDTNIKALQSTHFLPIQVHYTLSKLLTANCNGYVIATPASSHCTLIHQLIPEGKPIFVEKPLVINAKEALSLAQFLNQKVFVMHIWRYHPGIKALGEVIKAGKIGKVLYVKSERCNWTSPRKDLDSIWNLLPHDLTICEALFGRILDPKFAISEQHHGISRGTTVILGDQPYYQIEISNRYWEKKREIRVHGTEGVIVLRNESIDHLEYIAGNDAAHYENLEIQKIYFDHTRSALEIELTAFLDFLKGGTPPPTNLQEGIRITNAILHVRDLAKLS